MNFSSCGTGLEWLILAPGFPWQLDSDFDDLAFSARNFYDST
jgi:hypothetical protein